MHYGSRWSPLEKILSTSPFQTCKCDALFSSLSPTNASHIKLRDLSNCIFEVAPRRYIVAPDRWSSLSIEQHRALYRSSYQARILYPKHCAPLPVATSSLSPFQCSLDPKTLLLVLKIPAICHSKPCWLQQAMVFTSSLHCRKPAWHPAWEQMVSCPSSQAPATCAGQPPQASFCIVNFVNAACLKYSTELS